MFIKAETGPQNAYALHPTMEYIEVAINGILPNVLKATTADKLDPFFEVRFPVADSCRFFVEGSRIGDIVSTFPARLVPYEIELQSGKRVFGGALCGASNNGKCGWCAHMLNSRSNCASSYAAGLVEDLIINPDTMSLLPESQPRQRTRVKKTVPLEGLYKCRVVDIDGRNRLKALGLQYPELSDLTIDVPDSAECCAIRNSSKFNGYTALGLSVVSLANGVIRLGILEAGPCNGCVCMSDEQKGHSGCNGANIGSFTEDDNVIILPDV